MLPHLFYREDDFRPADTFWEPYRLTRAFYAEVSDRDSFKSYCQWYAQTAAQNRADLETMRRETNWLAWFRA